jgi:hypothetical protein
VHTVASEFRLFEFESGQPMGAVVSLPDSRSLVVGKDGHFTLSSGTDSEVVYVAQTATGQQTLTPAEFASQYGWRNDPAKGRLSFPSTAGSGRSANRSATDPVAARRRRHDDMQD